VRLPSVTIVPTPERDVATVDYMKIAIVPMIVAACVSASTTTHAQEFDRNAWGVYAAPTIYGFAEGNDYDVAASGAGLDFGLYYSRFLTQNLSVRLEARYGTRNMDDLATIDLFPGAFTMFRLAEDILEVPVVLQADRRVPVGDHVLRVSVGGGFSYKFVLEQKLIGFSGGSTSDYLTPADSYRKFGILLDGGVTFDVDRKSAIFARLRLDTDIGTMGEPDAADVIRRFWATGLYVGYEMAF
jgi:hypothetical protein